MNMTAIYVKINLIHMRTKQHLTNATTKEVLGIIYVSGYDKV